MEFDAQRKRRGLVAALALAFAWTSPVLAAPAPAASSAPAAPTAAAAPSTPAAAPAPAAAGRDFSDLAADQQLLVRLQNQAPSTTNDQRLAAMGRQAAAVQAAADARLSGVAARLAAVQAALQKRPFDRPRRLTRTQAAAEAQLLGQQAALRIQLGQVQPTAALAAQTYSQIAERRRESFSDRVLEQTSSPLSPDFWTSLASSAGADLGRLRAQADLDLAAAWDAPEPRGMAGLIIGGLAAFLFLAPIRWWLGRLGWRLCSRLRAAPRTPAIVWTVVVDIAAAVFAVSAARLGLKWGGLLVPSADLLARGLVGGLFWAAAVLALGRAMATDPDADHRLLRISDGQALRARFALVVVALVSAAGLFLQRLNYVVGTSVAATIATNCAVSLAYAAAALLLLVSFSPQASERAPDQPRAPARTLISLLIAAAAVATIGAVLLGYSTLAALISGQVFWLSLLAAATWLILRLIDDLCGLFANERSRTTHVLANLLGLKISTVIQVGLLTCAGLQLMIALAAVTMALTPFGQSGELLVRHIRALGESIQIGKATLSPLAIAAGLATFGVGVSLAHMARAWLVRRYLPATDWDAGVRNSVSTGVAYVGVGVALVCALGVTGLGFAQIALIASALSVGIGFGLQQVVQNFVAGVILLIERPVKVGDWINVSGVEGDVLDIRVRATEIRTADCSTVIVPNSSLITSNVQNKSVGDRRTRLQLQVNVAKPADAPAARDLMLSLATANADALQTPKPEVYIEALAGGGAVQLSLWIYLADPREAQRVKSDLYFAILAGFQKADIAFQ